MTTLRSAASFAALVLIFGVCQVAVRAQTPPYLQMQYSTLTGSGNTITATMLPVVTSTGITTRTSRCCLTSTRREISR